MSENTYICTQMFCQGKTMKKLKYLLLVIAAAIATNGYAAKIQKSEDKQKDAFEINKELENFQLPMAFGNVGYITEMAVSGNAFRLVLVVEGAYEKQFSSLPADKLKEAFLLNIAPTGKALSPFIENGIGLTFVIRFKTNPGQETIVNLTADEIKAKIAMTPEMVHDETIKALQIQIDNINKTTPIQLDEYTVLDSCYLTKTDFVYSYTIKENEDFKLGQMENFDLILTQINKTQLRTQGLAVYSFLKKLVEVKHVLRYSYKGSITGKNIDIAFDEPILKEIIQQIESDNMK